MEFEFKDKYHTKIHDSLEIVSFVVMTSDGSHGCEVKASIYEDLRSAKCTWIGVTPGPSVDISEISGEWVAQYKIEEPWLDGRLWKESTYCAHASKNILLMEELVAYIKEHFDDLFSPDFVK